MNNRLRTELLSKKTGRRVTFNPEVKVENYNSPYCDPFFMVNCFDLILVCKCVTYPHLVLYSKKTQRCLVPQNRYIPDVCVCMCTHVSVSLQEEYYLPEDDETIIAEEDLDLLTSEDPAMKSDDFSNPNDFYDEDDYDDFSDDDDDDV